jgi:hypothetical protein
MMSTMEGHSSSEQEMVRIKVPSSASWEVMARRRLAMLQDSQQRETYWHAEAVKWRTLAMEYLALAERAQALFEEALQGRTDLRRNA